MRSFPESMERPTERPQPPSEDPVEGRFDVPDTQAPGWTRPEPDPFPGYGEPPPDARRDSPPNVRRREWDPTGNTEP
jgi:hypothetical protein